MVEAIYWIKNCKKCGSVIDSRKDGFSISSYRGIYCSKCTEDEFLESLKKMTKQKLKELFSILGE